MVYDVGCAFLTASPYVSTRPWMRWSMVVASSSVFTFWMPAPSSLGPAAIEPGVEWNRAWCTASTQTSERHERFCAARREWWVLLHFLQPRVRPQLAARFRLRLAVEL